MFRGREIWYGSQIFEDGQLMVLVEDDEEDAEDVEVDDIDVAGWEKKNRLWVVLPEHRL